MAPNEKNLDVLQNIEFGIVVVYREDPELVDSEVLLALEAVIEHYAAERANRPPRATVLPERAAEVFESVQSVCEWRLGRVELEKGDSEAGVDKPEPRTVEEMISCLKTILKSATKWTRRGGRRGYLDFVSRFIR